MSRITSYLIILALLIGCTRPVNRVSQHAALLTFSDLRGLELSSYPAREVKGRFSMEEIRQSLKTHQNLVRGKNLFDISFSGDLLFVEGSQVLVVSPNFSAKRIDTAFFDMGVKLRQGMVTLSPDGRSFAAVVPKYISEDDLVGKLYTVNLDSGSKSKALNVRLSPGGKIWWSHDSNSLYLDSFEKGSLTAKKIELVSGKQTILTIRPMVYASDSPMCIMVDPATRELQVIEFEPAIKIIRKIPASEDWTGVFAFIGTGEAIRADFDYDAGGEVQYKAFDWRSGSERSITSSPSEAVALIRKVYK